jgi:hypothetical protein
VDSASFSGGTSFLEAATQYRLGISIRAAVRSNNTAITNRYTILDSSATDIVTF